MWQRPSRDEADGASALPALPLFENPEDAEESTEIPAPAVAGSSTRGLILHKLIEELLTGELQGGVLEIERRTVELLGQLGIKPVDDPKDRNSSDRDSWHSYADTEPAGNCAASFATCAGI